MLLGYSSLHVDDSTPCLNDELADFPPIGFEVYMWELYNGTCSFYKLCVLYPMQIHDCSTNMTLLCTTCTHCTSCVHLCPLVTYAFDT